MANSLCIEWQGWHTKAGYGQLTRDGKKIYAHRDAWEKANGPIPKGMHVLHRCDNPPCVNPEHLFLGTHTDNMHDMIAKGRNSFIAKAPRGAEHPASKLTDTAVIWMRYLRSLGFTHQRISEIVGGSRRNVASVCAGLTWTHLEVCHR